MNGPQVTMLADNRRLHLHHGPIDLIIEAFGAHREIQRAYDLAISRFEFLLAELVKELPLLRQRFTPQSCPTGSIACAMANSVKQFYPEFITPMAAVAGSVADAILASMLQGTHLEKAYVNNGGDTAFHLASDQSINAGIATSLPAKIKFAHTSKYRGVATSGWRGRSQSLGIADSVCVVAKNAATADAAATMIANQVNLPNHVAIERMPAIEVFPDSDLGERLVTTRVGTLSQCEKLTALSSGRAAANSYLSRGIIGAALLVLDDEHCQVGMQNLIHIKTGELANA